jgi:hypothetical protein
MQNFIAFITFTDHVNHAPLFASTQHGDRAGHCQSISLELVETVRRNLVNNTHFGAYWGLYYAVACMTRKIQTLTSQEQRVDLTVRYISFSISTPCTCYQFSYDYIESSMLLLRRNPQLLIVCLVMPQFNLLHRRSTHYHLCRRKVSRRPRCRDGVPRCGGKVRSYGT